MDTLEKYLSTTEGTKVQKIAREVWAFNRWRIWSIWGWSTRENPTESFRVRVGVLGLGIMVQVNLELISNEYLYLIYLI